VTVAKQADRAEQGRRAMGELIEEGVDVLPQLRPVVGETVGFEHVAAQPAPPLLDRVEPGGVGRQPDGFAARQLAQRRHHVGVVMDRPIVLHDVEALCRGIELIAAVGEGADLRPG
jgi:hypothetical protein